MAWLYRVKNSNYWRIGYRVGRKQVSRSTGTVDRAEAEKELAKVEQMFQAHRAGNLTEELFQLLTGQEVTKVSLRRALDDWLAECRGASSDKTQRKYMRIAGELAEHFRASQTQPLIGEIATQDVRAFLNDRRSRLSTSTLNQWRKIIASFFNWCVKNQLLRDNPVTAIKPFKGSRQERQSRRIFTLDEVRTMFEKAPTPFWQFMVISAFYTGQRMGDLICLRWGAIDTKQRTIRFISRKTERSIHIPLASPLEGFLRSTFGDVETKDPTAFIWPEEAASYERSGAGRFSNQFHRLVMAPAGLAPSRSHKAQKAGRAAKRAASSVGFHCFRHTFVTYLKLTGGNQAIAKELAGHSSDLVSDLYTHLPSDVLSDAINQLPSFEQE